jgi:hypothetical protein
MQGLSASQMIGLWERGAGQHPVDRSLTLLAAACPEFTPEQLWEFRIGRRDVCLLRLRERIFGPTMDATAKCPQCGETVEFTLRTADLDVDSAAVEQPQELEEGEITVRFRLPNSSDLAAISRRSGVADARQALLKRCVIEASIDGALVDSEALSEQVVLKLAARLAEGDPQGDLTLDLKCVECGHPWQIGFDIAAFLWTEIDALAKRLLSEVHILARAYGWSEADVLAMGAARRHFYLAMVG